MEYKGFIAVLDALIALMLLVMFTTIIFSQLQKSPSLNDALIFKQGYDILSVLEYTNFSDPQGVFSETSAPLCMRLELYNGIASQRTGYYVKNGCDYNYESERTIWRTFVEEGEFKTAKLAIWSRQ